MMQALRSPLLMLEGASPIRCLLLRMRETRCNEVGSWGVGHERPRSSSGSAVLIEPRLRPPRSKRGVGRAGGELLHRSLELLLRMKTRRQHP
jgi:hypothetical protein